MNKMSISSIVGMIKDNTFEEELCRLLDELVEAELEKDDDDIDFELIDDCTRAIVEIESGGSIDAERLVELISDTAFELKDGRSKLVRLFGRSRVALVAAIVILSTITASAEIGNLDLEIFRKPTESETAVSTTASEKATSTTKHKTTKKHTTEKSTTKASAPVVTTEKPTETKPTEPEEDNSSINDAEIFTTFENGEAQQHVCTLAQVMEKATTESNGLLEYRCDDCGEVFTRELPRLEGIVLSKKKLYYNGKRNVPESVSVVDSSGNVVDSKHYKVNYPKSSVGCGSSYIIEVVFTSDCYEGSLTESYSIVPRSVEIESVSIDGDYMKVKWKKSKYAEARSVSGYEIEYSYINFYTSSVEVVENVNATSCKIDGILSDCRYLVRMRAYYYDEENDSTVYSKWSETVTVETR